MSQENVEVVRRIYDQLALGNFWAIAPLLDPEITWDWGSEMALVEGPTVYRGPKGVEAATREWLKAWDGARIEVEKLFDADEQVVAFTHMYARPKHGGPEVEMLSAQVWVVRDGLVTSMKNYTRAEALKAVGLEEQEVSEENVEIAKRGIAAFNARDVTRFASFTSPNFVWLPSMGAIEGRAFAGRIGIDRYFDTLGAAWESFQIVPGTFQALDDVVIMLGRLEGLGKGSGVPVDSELGMVFDFGDGSCWRIRGYLTHTEALEAGGLAGQAPARAVPAARR